MLWSIQWMSKGGNNSNYILFDVTISFKFTMFPCFNCLKILISRIAVLGNFVGQMICIAFKSRTYTILAIVLVLILVMHEHFFQCHNFPRLLIYPAHEMSLSMMASQGKLTLCLEHFTIGSLANLLQFVKIITTKQKEKWKKKTSVFCTRKNELNENHCCKRNQPPPPPLQTETFITATTANRNIHHHKHSPPQTFITTITTNIHHHNHKHSSSPLQTFSSYNEAFVI